MPSPPLTCWTGSKGQREQGLPTLPATLFFSVAGVIFPV